MSEYTSHYSVMFNDVIEYFKNIEDDNKNFIDGTFGGGGHTFGMAEIYKANKVFSFDQDPEAFANGKNRIDQSEFNSTIHLINDNFNNFQNHLEEFKGKISGIILDLGVSSHHFDDAKRGFSFRTDAKLDMRMDTVNNPLTAKEIVNEYSAEDIADILFYYGEERLSRQIARNIVESREEKEIETTFELADIIKYSYPKKMRYGRIHPATKSFQALRIKVNAELDVLENSLPNFYDYLAPGGVLQVISFHSLEDRIVKHCFKKLFNQNKDGCKIITKRPILPSDQEVEENSRSRSAKLRVIKKLI